MITQWLHLFSFNRGLIKRSQSRVQVFSTIKQHLRGSRLSELDPCITSNDWLHLKWRKKKKASSPHFRLLQKDRTGAAWVSWYIWSSVPVYQVFTMNQIHMFNPVWSRCDTVHNWLNTKELKSDSHGVKDKDLPVHVHTVLWKIYNKYCLTVCSKNNMKYLFQMLYFLPYIEYLCMHGYRIRDDWKLRVPWWCDYSAHRWLVGWCSTCVIRQVVDRVMWPVIGIWCLWGENMKQYKHWLKL